MVGSSSRPRSGGSQRFDPVDYIRRNTGEILSLSIVDIYSINLPLFHSKQSGTRPLTADWMEHREPPPVKSELSSLIPQAILDGLKEGSSSLWIGLLGGHAASYIAVQLRTKRITMRHRFRLSRGECFIGPYYTDPGYRGLGLVGEGLQLVIGSLLAEESITIGYLDISRSNTSSIRVAARLGAERLPSFYLLVRLMKRDRLCVPFGICRDRIEKIGPLPATPGRGI